MLGNQSRQLRIILEYSDIVASACVFAFLASLQAFDPTGIMTSQVGAGPLVLALVATLSWPPLLRKLDVYGYEQLRDWPELLPKLALASLFAAALQSAVVLATSAPVAPLFPIACGVAQACALAGLRLAIFAGHAWLHPHARLVRNVLIVGSGPRAAYVRDAIDENQDSGLRVLGFLDTGVPIDGHCVPTEQVFKLSDMAGLLNDQVVDEVIVACPRSMLASIIEVVDACAAAGVPITLLSDLFGDYLPTPRTTRFGALPALTFAPVHHAPTLLAIKRMFDILGSALLLALSAPVISACALAIKLTSRGPVFFRQVRCGLNGRHFVMYKLRTMTTDADARKEDLQHLNEMDGPVFKISSDPRITRVGGLLRRTSLDELPQLWNVLRGDMSLVGPRPPVPVEVAEYRTFQRRRLSMRPGLTCIWQVSGRNRIGFDDWVRLDLEYIDTWSLKNDFMILFKTLPAVLHGSGAS